MSYSSTVPVTAVVAELSGFRKRSNSYQVKLSRKRIFHHFEVIDRYPNLTAHMYCSFGPMQS